MHKLSRKLTTIVDEIDLNETPTSKQTSNNSLVNITNNKNMIMNKLFQSTKQLYSDAKNIVDKKPMPGPDSKFKKLGYLSFSGKAAKNNYEKPKKNSATNLLVNINNNFQM